MALGKLRREEQIGLGLAIVLHAALLGLFLLRPAAAPVPVPQRISVTLSPETGLNATAPTHEDAAADLAPTLGAPPPAAVPAPVVSPPPAKVTAPPVVKPVPEPKPVAVTRPRPETVKPPAPVVAPPLPAKLTPRHHPAKPVEAPAAAKAAPKHVPSVKDWSLALPATPDHQPAGGSRIGNDFLKGVAGGKASGKAQQQGAAVLGPDARSALSGAIARQLKPHWVAPEGVDADKLVTILAWDLNPDGTLAGPPRVVRQEGITDSNRPQAARHAEQAIRAVELGAPFQLPAQYYAIWKHVRAFEFNRTLSQ
jgi:outer membrane biosynthesis protein TonB